MAMLAGSAEFGGGLATALGVGGPLAPTTMASTMAVAAATGHRGKPYFGQSGGPETAILYGTVGAYLALAGPGRDSIDRVIGIRVPRSLAVLYAAGAFAAAVALIGRARAKQDMQSTQQAPGLRSVEQGNAPGETPRLRASGA